VHDYLVEFIRQKDFRLSYATINVTSIMALKELVSRLHREQNKIQDLLSSLGFALRSFNNLNQIVSNNFQGLFSLNYLNLSHNKIALIEANSFQNLQKLKLLDLSYNRFLSIDNNLFYGLIKLNDLYLVNELNFQLNNKSFDHLESISKIYFNESIILLNDSIFDPILVQLFFCTFLGDLYGWNL
jgi:Leucine-rich repeat (LRR) protein